MKLANIKRLKSSRKALSPIFATLLLCAIVITFGSVAYYYASNVTTDATNEFSKSVAESQQTISQRIAVESVYFNPSDHYYDPNPSPTLTVYVINYGLGYDIKINSILLKVYDNNHNLLTTNPYNISPNTKSSATNPSGPLNMIALNAGPTILSLNPGEEGFFVVKLNDVFSPSIVTSLNNGQYSIQLITSSGSSFEYAP
jgi:flagellin-like protein